MVTYKENEITLVHWHDNRCVTMAFTHSGAKPLNQAKRYIRGEKQQKSMPMPNIIKEYNHSMGGVDCFDQNMSYCGVNLRSKKWWWPFFRFCVDLGR